MKLNTLVVALGLFAAPVALASHTGLTQLHQAEVQKALSKQGPMGMPGLPGPMAAAECENFIGLSGSALVSKLAASAPDCVSSLYNLKGSDATALFAESNMRAVMQGVNSRAASYTGTDSSGIESLIYFLRAGLYVQWYNPELVPAYSSAFGNDVKTGLTTLFNNSNAWIAADSNAGVLKEALILVDSAGLGAHFNWVTIKVLNEYNANWQASFGMNAAANAVFTTLFRAQWDEPMKTLFASDQSILDALNGFQSRNRNLLGTNAEYVLVNAVREMSRLYYIPQMESRVRTLVKAVLSSSSKNDASKTIWMAAAEMADYYDRANCNDYGICGFKATLEAETLSFNHKCSDTLKMRAQQLYVDQANWACTVLTGQESYFHQMLETGRQPVANDNNDDLELVIFNSSEDYGSYAGTFFGIDTNNGGMYLEGSPAGLKNQARFIAYEAEWRRPDFHVWNLQHEYVHYLDGRFNLHGDFARGMSANTVWWVEGLAEYISYRDANLRAIEMGETKAYALSTIFKNNYESGQDRIYRWGYLAVRFMFENHRDDVRTILNYLRNDKYTEYQAFMDNIGTRYDNEWYGWLTSGLSTANDGIVDKGPDDTAAEASGSTGNWSGPGSSISTDYSPCEVTNEAYRYTKDAELKIDQPMECIDAQNGRASFAFANESRSDAEIWIKIGGGWGDADIYFNSGSWASGENNEGYGIGNGNHEVIKVRLNPNEYWHYLTLDGDFGGVDLLLSTTEVVADPDPAQGGGDNGGGDNGGGDNGGGTPPADCGAATKDYGKLEFGVDECIAGGRSSFYFWVEEDNTEVTISTAGGSGNANLYFHADSWPDAGNAQARSEGSGNSERISVTVNRGWRYVSVNTDSEYSGVTLRLALGSGGDTGGDNGGNTPGTLTNACASQSPVSYTALESGVPVCASEGRNDYYVYVPAGTAKLTLRSAHGSGDVSLYGASGYWPTESNYQAISATAGSNTESISVSNPGSGWYYFMVQGDAGTSGVTVQLDMQ